jgi:hypothetical protein
MCQTGLEFCFQIQLAPLHSGREGRPLRGRAIQVDSMTTVGFHSSTSRLNVSTFVCGISGGLNDINDSD